MKPWQIDYYKQLRAMPPRQLIKTLIEVVEDEHNPHHAFLYKATVTALEGRLVHHENVIAAARSSINNMLADMAVLPDGEYLELTAYREDLFDRVVTALYGDRAWALINAKQA